MKKRILLLVIFCLMASGSVGACPEEESCIMDSSPRHPIYQGEPLEMNDLVYRGEPINVLTLHDMK